MKKILLSVLALAAFLSTATAQTQPRSDKRGFGEDNLNYIEDLRALARGCTWFYNWGVAPTSFVAGSVGADKGIAFVPMAWNGGFDETKLSAYYDAHTDEHYLLGFNEPNFKEQANMTPEAAVEPWHRLEAYAEAKGLKLVAPALNYSAWQEYSTPEKWMDEFIAKYKEKYGTEPRFDVLALHCYMNDPTALINYVENFAKKYGRKVWLTEFCSWEGNVTAASQQQSMLAKVQLLEQSDYVERYAWFKARGADKLPFYNLVEYPVPGKYAKGTLSELGFAYVHAPVYAYTRDKYYAPGEAIPASMYLSQTALPSIRRSADTRAVDSADVCFQGMGCTLTYQVSAETEGDYYLVLRYSTEAGSSIIPRLLVTGADGQNIVTGGDRDGNGKVYLDNTGAADVYKAVTTLKVHLKAGRQQIVLKRDNARAVNLSLLKVVGAIDASDPDVQTSDPTGILHVTPAAPATQSAAAFNLSGRRVPNGYKGIVIKNGRKYFRR